MTTYAVMDEGSVVGHREIEDWENYPAHKKEARDEKGDGGPTLRPLVIQGEGSLLSYEVQLDQVILHRSNPPLTIFDVKAEAQNRIITLLNARDLDDCLVKQSNIQMEVNYLNDKRLNGETLTEVEEQWAAWARNLRLVIKGIREKSNQIEVMDPLPADFRDDSYWS